MLYFKFYLSYKHTEIGGQVLMRDTVLFGQGRDFNIYLFSHRNNVATGFVQKFFW